VGDHLEVDVAGEEDAIELHRLGEKDVVVRPLRDGVHATRHVPPAIDEGFGDPWPCSRR
jgi:hypothetical protein